MVFLVAAALASTRFVRVINLAFSHFLVPLGRTWPWLNGVWVAGGVPLSLLAVLWASRARSRGQRLRLLGLFVAGGIIELLAKHWIATPWPVPVAAPAPYAVIARYTNIEPSAVMAVVGPWLGARRPTASASFLRGSFPSGHVLRLTFAIGVWLGPGRWGWTTALAAVAAVAVVATGGHWFWDTLGGWSLAQALLVLGHG